MFGQSTFISKYGFAPDFGPQDELNLAGPDPKAQDEAATKRISVLREEMLRIITLLAKSKVFSTQLVSEARDILEDVIKTHLTFKYSPHPYKDAPMLPAYKKAFTMIKSIALPNTVTAEQEQKIIAEITKPSAPKASFLTENFQPIVIGGTALLIGIFGAFLLLRN